MKLKRKTRGRFWLYAHPFWWYPRGKKWIGDNESLPAPRYDYANCKQCKNLKSGLRSLTKAPGEAFLVASWRTWHRSGIKEKTMYFANKKENLPQ